MYNSAFEFQLRLFEKEIDEIQRIIARYDDLIFKVKTITITLWVAVIGWSFTINNNALSIVGLTVILGFWSLGATYRAIQIRYINRSKELSSIVSDQEKLRDIFMRSDLSECPIYQLSEGEGIRTKAMYFARGYASPSIFIFYCFLVVINIFIMTYA